MTVEPDRSFERMYRRHRRAVYGSVLRDVRDPDEAEDVTQVAFLNAFRALSRGDNPERPRAWLLTIARNVVRRRARLRAARPQEVALDPEIAFALDDVESSTADDIHAALGRLPERQQRAIVLREIRGFSYAEIAGALDLSIPAVEALVFRARRALAEELELLERAPVVQRRGARGLLALPLPGVAKLGSLGFTLGRAAAVCAVGCAVVAAVPVVNGDAGRELPAVAQRAPSAREAAGSAVLRSAPAAERASTKVKRNGRGAGGRAVTPSGSSGSPATKTQDGSLLGVELPAIDVPAPSVPGVPLPPLPSVDPPALPGLPPLPGATS